MATPDIKLFDAACPVCNGRSADVLASGPDFQYGTTKNVFQLRKCPGCEVIYLSPRPDDSEINRIYPANYQPFHFHRLRNPFARWSRHFVQREKASFIRKMAGPGAEILEVGCGSGVLLKLMKEHGRPDWKLYGNDTSPLGLAEVERNGIRALPGAFETLETPLRFDLIIANQALEHMAGPVAALAKMRVLLKDTGRIFIETPSFKGLDAVLFSRSYWGGYHIPRHWALFCASSMHRVLEGLGFREISITHILCPASWTESFYNWFLDHGFPMWWVRLWHFNNPLLLVFFSLIDYFRLKLRLPTSYMRVIASK